MSVETNDNDKMRTLRPTSPATLLTQSNWNNSPNYSVQYRLRKRKRRGASQEEHARRKCRLLRPLFRLQRPCLQRTVRRKRRRRHPAQLRSELHTKIQLRRGRWPKLLRICVESQMMGGTRS